jgi:hypothetical protein
MRDNKDCVDNSTCDSADARALVASILHHIDSANVCIAALEIAIPTRNHTHIISLRSTLQTAWADGYRLIAKLESISGHREEFARAALHKSLESARGSLAMLWQLVLQASKPESRT